VGIRGTGAGKGIRGVLAVSGVGGNILKNIGGGYNIKWCRVSIIARCKKISASNFIVYIGSNSGE
jgi:hypothetical protein